MVTTVVSRHRDLQLVGTADYDVCIGQLLHLEVAVDDLLVGYVLPDRKFRKRLEVVAHAQQRILGFRVDGGLLRRGGGRLPCRRVSDAGARQERREHEYRCALLNPLPHGSLRLCRAWAVVRRWQHTQRGRQRTGAKLGVSLRRSSSNR